MYGLTLMSVRISLVGLVRKANDVSILSASVAAISPEVTRTRTIRTDAGVPSDGIASWKNFSAREQIGVLLICVWSVSSWSGVSSRIFLIRSVKAAGAAASTLVLVWAQISVRLRFTWLTLRLFPLCVSSLGS